MVHLALCCWASVACAATPTRPDFDRVVTAATTYFRSLPNYQEGDLISQRNVAAALDAIEKIGWRVPDRKKLEQRALANDSFLVREFSTPAGRDFMRKLARKPGTFERLDRLATISRGETLIRDLIYQKDGDLLVEYLATTEGGRNMGRMMADTPGGVDLNRPTDRIYTAADLVKAVKSAYQSSTP